MPKELDPNPKTEKKESVVSITIDGYVQIGTASLGSICISYPYLGFQAKLRDLTMEPTTIGIRVCCTDERNLKRRVVIPYSKIRLFELATE